MAEAEFENTSKECKVAASKEIVDALEKRGIDVPAAIVSQIKATRKRKLAEQ